ncbi:hypothetical protein [Pontibacter ramchanderi]|uniref:Uncharacterized protein n=1 Tax=Pontibacter ramchanderi TaxID=1179743 RepID=A0A2N3V0V4_9BACT|nr:hypothetical protein [Pontibacter ramchanderi]PKV75269.1 hypothetical protein BD749_0207 [Pontibacter ramchanderi]
MIDIYTLFSHLKSCPEYFFQCPPLNRGQVSHTEVLLMDMYRKVHGDFSVADAALPTLVNLWQNGENQLVSMQVGCWLFHHPFFAGKPEWIIPIDDFLNDDLEALSAYVQAREWVEDEDRAEEFIRLALNRCEVTPAGETALEAADRLEALDTLKRQAVLRGSQASYDRIREIRRKMAEQKAREAANVYGRE